MTAGRSAGRALAAVALAVAVLVPLAATHWAALRYTGVLAARDAVAAAGYLAIVTPPVRGGAGFNGTQLFIRARALAHLPGLSTRIEVYDGTAPLVRATAPPLSPETLERLRRDVAIQATGEGMLAPLLDRDGWEVVGAVAADAGAAGWPVSPWSLAALVLVFVAGVQAMRALDAPPSAWRPALARYAVAAALYGVAAFADLRLDAQTATDNWLSDTRALMQEATARVPDLRLAPSRLARLAPDAVIVPGDSAGPDVTRRDVAGVGRATAAVRLGPGRWIELQGRPVEAGTVAWLAVLLAVAFIGPVGARLAAWRGTVSPKRWREAVAAWAFLAPSGLHLIVFTVGPLAFALYLALHRVNPTEPLTPLIGFAGFAQAFGDRAMWAALGRTLVYACYVPVTTMLALVLALLLHHRAQGSRLVLGLFALPSVVSVAAVALVWRWLYHADHGIISALAARAGWGSADWLATPGLALAALMVVSLWTQLGAQMAVFLAGLERIPQSCLDAARVDGATAWQRFSRVTFPLLRPVTLGVLVTGVLGAAQALTLFVILTGGGPFDSTEVLMYRIYRTGWQQFEFGDASVAALLFSAPLVALSWSLLRRVGRRVEYA